MNTNTIILLGAIAAVSVVGFVVWKKYNDDKAKQSTVLPTNTNQRNTSTTIKDYADAAGSIYGTLQDIERDYAGW